MKPVLADKYGINVPRYTSYPTAPHFDTAVDAVTYGRWLAELDPALELSLYFHIPFCESMCWFCACHTKVVRRYDPVAEYVATMGQEIDLVADALPARFRAGHLHWGGGSPSILHGDDWVRIVDSLRARFDIATDAELAVELDPRTTTRAYVATLAAAGVNRVSIGVQDIHPEVQQAINRVQPFEVTERVVRWLRGHGIDRINMDLIYGLPHQTTRRVVRMVDRVLSLRPARVALFGYAHVPWMKPHQRMIDESALPDTAERWDQCAAAAARLERAGYIAIGLDHFALPDDELATALGDPDGLLGGNEDLGITCALIRRDLPGIGIGDRHDPMGVPFANGPITGENVFVPLDAVIGGQSGIGQGWRMLMDCLAAGRSVSLPSLSVGAVQLAARTAGAYATIREQFNMPIGRFEGIEEPLARIAGHAYVMDAARVLTCGAVDAGEKPAVLSAVVKAYLTDAMRHRVNDAMDILAGAGICRGPRNILGRAFVGVPIGITVEGANILTRSLIIFGQGSIRCHPFVHDEMEAIANRDPDMFDRAFFGHVNFVFRNGVRALVLGLTNGRLAAAPVTDATAKHFRTLTRYAAAFALVTDAALGTLGGALKRREKITGRLADALAWLYLGSAALKRFHGDGRPAAERPLLEWSMAHALWQIEAALGGVLDNLPNRFAATLLRPLVFPWGMRRRAPDDRLGHTVANALLDGNELRLRLTPDVYVPGAHEDGLGRLEAALEKVLAAREARDKVRDAVRNGTLDAAPRESLNQRARDAGVIDAAAYERLAAAETAQDEAIQVDVFDPERYAELKG
jgi:alkylation response protein AidB-like acyl-CoA dehydrogenase